MQLKNEWDPAEMKRPAENRGAIKSKGKAPYKSRQKEHNGTAPFHFFHFLLSFVLLIFLNMRLLPLRKERSLAMFLQPHSFLPVFP